MYRTSPQRPRFQAFTLTELLSILAILAILSAILMPLFGSARARSQEVACISNLQQLGRAAHLYTQDFDGTYPIGNGYFNSSPQGSLNVPLLGDFPYNWRCANGNCNVAFGLLVKSYWFNSIFSYVGNYNVYLCPEATTRLNIGGTQGIGAPNPENLSYAFNGLLQSYAVAGVLYPGETPLLWEGNGKGYVSGFGDASPFLNCPQKNVKCVYRPIINGNPASGNGGKSGFFSFVDSAWVHGRGMHFLEADGHVRWLRLGVLKSGSANTDPCKDPFALYNASGVPTSAWTDTAHIVYFEPDWNHCH